MLHSEVRCYEICIKAQIEYLNYDAISKLKP